MALGATSKHAIAFFFLLLFAQPRLISKRICFVYIHERRRLTILQLWLYLAASSNFTSTLTSWRLCQQGLSSAVLKLARFAWPGGGMAPEVASKNIDLMASSPSASPFLYAIRPTRPAWFVNLRGHAVCEGGSLDARTAETPFSIPVVLYTASRQMAHSGIYLMPTFFLLAARILYALCSKLNVDASVLSYPYITPRTFSFVFPVLSTRISVCAASLDVYTWLIKILLVTLRGLSGRIYRSGRKLNVVKKKKSNLKL